ncbi:MAG: phosphatase PAP2 family protein [Bradyrhizobium sp.]|uniref:phosphatase PAP2 family protein n=1 Tax=Bradyrhizobium sp. TaxID=376 RepID=UPI0025BA4613|nr:phosphatase PAP2 family protein [Bradyrhizobium sp.]MBI5263442.1 phosphatase PAP2 family protein [Bradyrhizobium sp.]
MITFNRSLASSVAAAWLVVAAGTARVDAAGERPTWILSTVGDRKTAPPPTGEAATAELTALKTMLANRNVSAIAQVRWWDVGGPAYRWNEIAVREMLTHSVTVPLALRNLALIHAAIHDAVVSALANKKSYARERPFAVDPQIAAVVPVADSGSYPSDFGAAAGAASEVLAYLFPADADRIRKLGMEAAQSRVIAGVEYPSDVEAGLDLGRQTAARAIEHGKQDGSDLKWTGTVPSGAGKWRGTSPINPAAATWKSWSLKTSDEFRPPPPPDYDSAAVLAELAELKSFARTPRTNSIAVYWETFGGVRSFQLWNEHASRKVLEYGLGQDPAAATYAFAAMNIAMHDACIACWDAKFTYWRIRPSQLDPELKTLFPPPNHPSYPAAHGCISTAAAVVLARLFPDDADTLLAIGKEAADARMYAGIHYRSDLDAGQALGRAVAEKVLARASDR